MDYSVLKTMKHRLKALVTLTGPFALKPDATSLVIVFS